MNQSGCIIMALETKYQGLLILFSILCPVMGDTFKGVISVKVTPSLLSHV